MTRIQTPSPRTDAQIDAEFADYPEFVRSYLKGLEEFFRTEIWPGEGDKHGTERRCLTPRK